MHRSRESRLWLLRVILLIVAIGWSSQSPAQVVGANLSGSVTDENGGVLPGATVTA